MALRLLCTSALSSLSKCSNPVVSGYSVKSIIDHETGHVRVQGYHPSGFIVNNVHVEGAILCYQDLWLLWDIKDFQAINDTTLSFLKLISPKPEILVLGCGPRMEALSKELRDTLKVQGLAVELQDTRNAVSCFNFLTDEGRLAVAALLPYGSPTVY